MPKTLRTILSLWERKPGIWFKRIPYMKACVTLLTTVRSYATTTSGLPLSFILQNQRTLQRYTACALLCFTLFFPLSLFFAILSTSYVPLRSELDREPPTVPRWWPLLVERPAQETALLSPPNISPQNNGMLWWVCHITDLEHRLTQGMHTCCMCGLNMHKRTYSHSSFHLTHTQLSPRQTHTHTPKALQPKAPLQGLLPLGTRLSNHPTNWPFTLPDILTSREATSEGIEPF